MPLGSEVLAPKPGKKENVRPQLDVLEFDFFAVPPFVQTGNVFWC